MTIKFTAFAHFQLLCATLFAGALLMLGAGCVAPPAAPAELPHVETKNADYGTYPTDYEALLKAWTVQHLKDPDSAKYGRISKPRKEYMFEDKVPFYGYAVCADVNAKNAYGGYTGSHTFWFLFRDGKIARAQDTTMPIAGMIPGTTISMGHMVNCNDGDAAGN